MDVDWQKTKLGNSQWGGGEQETKNRILGGGDGVWQGKGRRARARQLQKRN